MDEQEWLSSADSGAMLGAFDRLGGPPGTGDLLGIPADPAAARAYLESRRPRPRKLRLFTCACCRRVWSLLDERSHRAVGIAERFADGRASAEELNEASRLARIAWEAAWGAEGPEAARAAQALAPWAAREAVRAAESQTSEALSAARGAAEATAEALRTRGPTAESRERAAQADLLRCLFGNPFDPPPPVPESVLAWRDGTVVKLAEAVHADRAFDRLPVLADALEEAGCFVPALLDHCREHRNHAQGCFVLDAILRMEEESPQ
jgi:hypothetical protein